MAGQHTATLLGHAKLLLDLTATAFSEKLAETLK